MLARANKGEPPGLAVLARLQRAGRGSRGRGWVEPPAGNLAITVLLRPEGGPEETVAWPFLAALALLDALSDGGRLRGLELKWPNDVMLHGRKLAGILIERAVGGVAGRDWIAIGFGANLAAAPVVPGRMTACLAEVEAAPDAVLVATRLLAAIDARRDRLRHSGFAALREEWEARAHPRGTLLAVRDRGDQVGGSFAGIAEDGSLLLETADGRRRFATGEVLAATEQ